MTPNPGSDKALNLGCRCAVLCNGHGRGYMGLVGIFVMSVDCPLHGANARKQDATPEDDSKEAME